jgi:hypothetical protein
MAPKIVLKDGRVIYGILDVSTDFVQKNGLVAYTKSIEKAKGLTNRIGSNPFIVKAEDKHQKVNVVLSKEKAAQIRYADTLANFLNKCEVIFVID